MEALRGKSCYANQIFVVSGVLAMILSCGLGLGYVSVFLHRSLENDDEHRKLDDESLRFIETVGEIAFVPSIVIIPYTMQKKGRRTASLATIVPLLFSWVISFDTNHFASLVIFNILHNISLGGAVTISSVIISEFCSPKYRGIFLMLETAMISLGVLLSHVSGLFSCCGIISTIGVLTALYSSIVIYYWPESPYWLIDQGLMGKCAESFNWLRGHDEEAYNELEAMMTIQNRKIQLKALKPIRKIEVKEQLINYIKSLLKADFLRPLSIMILLFSFVGFGGENVVSSYSLRNIFKLPNGKYIGTIILDVLTLVCSLTACALIQVVKRKTLFIFTGTFAVIFLALTSLFLFLQSIEMFSRDYMWLFLTLITGFVMFMSLGTSALPFSLLGEIFPMSYKGIGSSLTCAYLWAFGNSMLKLMPFIAESIGVHNMLIITVIAMLVILILLIVTLPETNTKTLLEIENLINLEHKYSSHDYERVDVTEREDIENFDRLKLFIQV